MSPIITKDKTRKIGAMEDMFKTSGIFSKRPVKHQKKKSKFWGPNELMALMGSVSGLKDEKHH